MLKANDKHNRQHSRLMQRSSDAGIPMHVIDYSKKADDPDAYIQDPALHHSKRLPRPNALQDSELHNMFRHKRNEASDRKLGKELGIEGGGTSGTIRIQHTGRGHKRRESAHILNALSMTNGQHIARLRQVNAKTARGKDTLNHY